MVCFEILRVKIAGVYTPENSQQHPMCVNAEVGYQFGKYTMFLRVPFLNGGGGSVGGLGAFAEVVAGRPELPSCTIDVAADFCTEVTVEVTATGVTVAIMVVHDGARVVVIVVRIGVFDGADAVLVSRVVDKACTVVVTAAGH